MDDFQAVYGNSNIAKALVKAQSKMGKVIKNSDNKHFKSKYADLSAVLEACQEALNECGICFIQPCGQDEHGRYVDTILIHESGDRIASRVHLVLEKQTMQGAGSAYTYARRYGLMGLAGIAPEDDDGNAASIPSSPTHKGLANAFADGVLDALPENATPEEKAEAFKEAIIKDLSSKKMVKSLDNGWAKHRKYIENMQSKFPEKFGEIVDVYENTKMKIEGQI